jgi:hypothetical protein
MKYNQTRHMLNAASPQVTYDAKLVPAPHANFAEVAAVVNA